MPGALERVIRVLLHYYAATDHAPSTCTSARRAELRDDLRGAPSNVSSQLMAVTFADKLARIPHYEAGTASVDERRARGRGDVAQLASNESPYAPVEAVVEAVRAAAAGVNRYPDPGARRAALCARGPLRLPDRRGSRSATAPARSCSRRPRRCSSPAPRSSTPGPRSRCIRTWRRSRAPRSVRVPLDAGDVARPRGAAARDQRAHPDGARLQPEQPDRHPPAERRDRRVPREGARRACS